MYGCVLKRLIYSTEALFNIQHAKKFRLGTIFGMRLDDIEMNKEMIIQELLKMSITIFGFFSSFLSQRL